MNIFDKFDIEPGQTFENITDQRGYEYDLEINSDGTVNISSFEGHNDDVEVSCTALSMLINGECEYPLDVDEWDEWIESENDEAFKAGILSLSNQNNSIEM